MLYRVRYDCLIEVRCHCSRGLDAISLVARCEGSFEGLVWSLFDGQLFRICSDVYFLNRGGCWLWAL